MLVKGGVGVFSIGTGTCIGNPQRMMVFRDKSGLAKRLGKTPESVVLIDVFLLF